MAAHLLGTRRLAADGHPGRVAAEICDMGLHPTQRRLLVEEGVVAHVAAALGPQGGVGQRSEHAQPVLDGDDHDPALPGQLEAVVLIRTAVDAPAPVEEDEDRQVGPSAGAGRPLHVEEQAVLGLRSDPVGARELGAPVAVFGGVADT
jgi:hypothetical protein